MKSKRTIIGIICLFLTIAFGVLTMYSYRQLLADEPKFMPQFGSLPTRQERRVFFRLGLHSVTWLPAWTVTYREVPMMRAESDYPSLSVDLFGHIVQAPPREP